MSMEHNPGEPDFGEHAGEAEPNPGEPQFRDEESRALEDEDPESGDVEGAGSDAGAAGSGTREDTGA